MDKERYMKFAFFMFLVICFILISMTNSHAFRCGNEIITRGDSSSSVLNKCGEPSLREYGSEMYNGQLIYVEKWSYNCGASDFLYKITIYNSKVIKNDPFSRGSGYSQCNSPHLK